MMHRAIAERLRAEPWILERARKRVREWGERGDVHPAYVAAWAIVLLEAPEDVAALLVDESERARALRQVTPFAGVLDARERWRLWRTVSP
ncbi:MAG: hypothetical protein FWD69_08720 [Polyangiaceae bacterium]|nr:hypothetical protein [Polyangiaceae bacterium]